MNRFKRIATHGWLGKALSALTFGYYPVHDDELQPVYGNVMGPQSDSVVSGVVLDGFVFSVQNSGLIEGVQGVGNVEGPQETGLIVGQGAFVWC